jgi:predicted SAM-dependent methyltransferase
MKLHLGCGKKNIPGFFHMDIEQYPHLDQCGDIRDLSFLPEGSVELIYCCHAFEYFDRAEALAALQEWHRVLKKGGVLRLSVPDFSVLARLYLEGLELEKILGPLYGRIGATPRYHKTVYDFTSLKISLEAAKYTAVRRYDWRETEHRDFDDFSQAYIPHMDKKNGTLISLNIEATKP